MENEIISYLVKQYGTQLYKFCISLCRNKDAADELYQNTFLKLIVSNKDYTGIDNILSFLFSTACFIYKSERRKSARRNKIAPTYSSEDISCISCDTDLADDTLNKIQRQTLLHLIDNLDFKYRQAIILFYAMDMSIYQIAQISNCSQNTVKSRLLRAKAKLKKEMEALGYEN